MYEQYDGKERFCKTCKYNQLRLIDFVCLNKESDNYMLETDCKDYCADWEEKDV